MLQFIRVLLLFLFCRRQIENVCVFTIILKTQVEFLRGFITFGMCANGMRMTQHGCASYKPSALQMNTTYVVNKKVTFALLHFL